MFYELVSYNQRLHKKSIKSSRWQGSLLIRWLQRHIMVFFVICSAVSELWRSPLSVNFIVDITKPDGERVETDCCIKMSIHSLRHFLWRSWWWFESSHMPRNCWSIHQTMKKFHLKKENLMLNQLCHLSPQWTQSSFSQWTKFSNGSIYYVLNFAIFTHCISTKMSD